MQNEYILKGQIEKAENTVAGMEKHKADMEKGLSIFRWVTLLLYLAFTLSLYIGDIMHLRTIFESFGGSAVGFVLYLLIAVGLAYSLASFKHHFYIHRGIYGGAVPMVFVVILMGLTAEVFQSGGQQDIKARAGAANSAEYQNMLKTDPTALLNQGFIAPYAERIIELQGKLGRAKELERTCKNTCAAQRQKVEALQSQIASARELQASAATQRSADITTAQVTHSTLTDKVEEKHYNPTIKMVKETTGVGIGTAVTLIMGFISIIFEICHAYYSWMYNQNHRQIDAVNDQLLHFKGEFAQITGREYRHGVQIGARRVSPSQPTDLAEAKTEPSRQPSRPSLLDTGSPALPSLVSAFAPGIKATALKVGEAIGDEYMRGDAQVRANNAKFAAALGKMGAHIDDATSTHSSPAPSRSGYDPLSGNSTINYLAPATEANPALSRPAETELADQPGQLDANAELLAKAQAEIAEIKAANLAAAKAREEAARAAAEAKAREEAARAAAEAKAREEAARAAAEAKAREEAARAATEAKAREEAARAAAEAAAERAAALSGLTEDQVLIAAAAIRTAITSGSVERLGYNSLNEVIKAAGLPRATESIRKLIKLGCAELVHSGLVAYNPIQKRGNDEFLIAKH